MLKLALILSTAFLVTACASPKIQPKSAVIGFCDYAERIWFNSRAELEGLETDTLRQIKLHNDKVQTICGR